MTIDRFINLLVTITLIEIMLAIGLRVTLADLHPVAANRRLIAFAVLANYVLVPAATVGLLLAFAWGRGVSGIWRMRREPRHSRQATA